MIYFKLPLFLITLCSAVFASEESKKSKKKCVDIFIPTLFLLQCPVSEDLRIQNNKRNNVKKNTKVSFGK